jgi:O-antigen ligase
MESAPAGLARRRSFQAVPPASDRAESFNATWPIWLLALSLNGFFLYLAVLDAVDMAPRTWLTGLYYGILGAALGAAVWRRRDLLRERLEALSGLGVVCLGAGTVLAGWYLLNAALFSDGPLARRLTALLVLSTLPTALLALTTRAVELGTLAWTITGVALLIVPIELLALIRAGDDVFRFTPVYDLDVISAGLVPAIGAVAALALRPESRSGELGRLAAVALLGAAAVVPGSRGPVLALAAAVLALALVQPLRLYAVAVLALAVGVTAGTLVASGVGSLGYLVPGGDPPAKPEPSARHGDGRARPGPTVSTLSIRRGWIEDALRQVPDRPIAGHGVGMFVDRTPEAEILGVAGQRTYPHNTFVQAAYSLGAVGLVAFIAFLGSGAAALAAVIRRRDRVPGAAVPLVLGLGTFAFVNTNISGEIGSDVLLWTTVALAVSLHSAPGILNRL